MTAPGASLHRSGTASTEELSFAAYLHLWPIHRSARDWKIIVGFVLAVPAKSLLVCAMRDFIANPGVRRTRRWHILLFMMDDTKDRYRPRTFEDPAVSLVNEPVAFRDYGDATVLRRWPKARPLHAVIAETLSNVELLLAQLESGVSVPDSQRQLVRDL